MLGGGSCGLCCLLEGRQPAVACHAELWSMNCLNKKPDTFKRAIACKSGFGCAQVLASISSATHVAATTYSATVDVAVATVICCPV